MKDQGNKRPGDSPDADADGFLQELDSLMQLLAAQRRERAAASAANAEDKAQRAIPGTVPSNKAGSPPLPMKNSPPRNEQKSSPHPGAGVPEDTSSEVIPVLTHRASQTVPTLTSKPSGGGEIPVLSEVVAKGAGTRQPPIATRAGTAPSPAELEALVETLLERRLDELKPVLRDEILEQVKRLFPRG